MMNGKLTVNSMNGYDDHLDWLFQSLGVPTELFSITGDCNYASAKVSLDMFLRRIGGSWGKEQINDQR